MPRYIVSPPTRPSASPRFRQLAGHLPFPVLDPSALHTLLYSAIAKTTCRFAVLEAGCMQPPTSVTWLPFIREKIQHSTERLRSFLTRHFDPTSSHRTRSEYYCTLPSHGLSSTCYVTTTDPSQLEICGLQACVNSSWQSPDFNHHHQTADFLYFNRRSSEYRVRRDLA